MNKKNIIYSFILFLLLLGFLGFVSARFDLTQEKRYTLSESTIQVLKSVQKPMIVNVYLEGDFPASFRQLQNETKFMLEEFRRVNSKIDYRFIDPIQTKISQDSLSAMGMEASILPDMKDGRISEIIIYPYAILHYNSRHISIPLIINQTGIDASEQLNKSIENLEYSLISNIKNISQIRKKNIGILINHDELRPQEFEGFMQLATQNYNAGPVIPQNKEELTYADVPLLQKMDALVIAKPRKPFTENEKLILDQYIMNGGKTLWMIDAVNAEMDTLFRFKKIMAYPQDLNLTDFFFNYGIRLNAGLVKDLKKSALIRLASGEIAGNPQYNSFLWPYYPLGISENQSSITKNINPVKLEFPTSIDTLGRQSITTNVLFESSNRTQIKQVPDFISLSEIVNADSEYKDEKITQSKIFAVSLEGKFSSAYRTRSERTIYPNFKIESAENKMIIIADGDVGRNQLYKGKALPLGEDLLTKQAYGNEQFLKNALDFLLDDSNLIELRNRNIEARLLDSNRITEQKTYWQWLNLLLPLGITVFLGALFYYMRKRKYS